MSKFIIFILLSFGFISSFVIFNTSLAITIGNITGAAASFLIAIWDFMNSDRPI